MIEADRQMQEEILRLAQENNKMLHKMRRSAFWGGLLKAIFWIAIIIAPIWFYSAYLAPIVQSMQNTVNQIQGVSAQAQGQLNGFGNFFKEWGAKFKTSTPAQQ